MTDQGFRPGQAAPRPAGREAVEGDAGTRIEGAWRVLPIEGAFEIAYEDGNGARSIRRVFARELKLGPGKTLLGGVDRDRDGYRGFRADRIRRLTDPDSGERIERDVVDWLIRRAGRTLRALNAARKQAERLANKAPRRARGETPAPL